MATSEERFLIEATVAADMLARLLDVDAGPRLIRAVSLLAVAVAVLTLVNGMNELVLDRAALAGAPDLGHRFPHLLGEVLLAKLLGGLQWGQFQFAEQRGDVTLVVLGNAVGADVELGEVERMGATGLDKHGVGSEDRVVKIRLMHLAVEVGGRQHKLGDLAAFGIPLLRPVAADAPWRLVDKPPAVRGRNVGQLPIGQRGRALHGCRVKEDVMPRGIRHRTLGADLGLARQTKLGQFLPDGVPRRSLAGEVVVAHQHPIGQLDLVFHATTCLGR